MIGIVFWGVGFLSPAQSVSDYAVRVSAVVQANPPRITLSWPADPNASGYTVYRKLRNDASWETRATLGSADSSYQDASVSLGIGYEYKVSKSAAAYSGVGYVSAGIEVPLMESRGKIILLVDTTLAASLTTELARLQQDLVGDGWTVLRHDVPRMAVDPANTNSNVWAARLNELSGIKSIITNDYYADPTNVKALFLLGHVPVPYSGSLSPDGHSGHLGAWPADSYYGDMDGLWTDTSLTSTGASERRHWNVPGDGKFDHNRPTSLVDLEVGRVDLANLPLFTPSETELMRRYLNKDHNFRHKLIVGEARGLIDDNFGLSTGEAFAANGWRNFAAFFGASNTFTGDWLTVPASTTYLWGYGCGGGTYTSCGGVATTTQLATGDPRIVFTILFGSYFGDWDSQNNLLRATLATTNYSLTCAWAGRPDWQLHHMGLGETIGFSARVNHNNTLYNQFYARFVHVALMGDPTLRMHPVAPPTNLIATANGFGGVDLCWAPSPDTVAGYYVYRATNAAGPFTRLTSTLITGTNYTDPGVGAFTYMVRAVKLEVSASGSYWNASQGIFVDYGGIPVLSIIAQDTNKVYGAPLPEFIVTYSGFVHGDTTNSLTIQPVLSTTATNLSPVGLYPITASGASSSNYTIVYVPGTLTITPAYTTGLLTSSPNPALPGQPVTFALTLNPVAPGAGMPSGTVRFKFNDTNAGAVVSLTNGVAAYTTANLAHGIHGITTEYDGDGNFQGVTNTLSQGQVINNSPVANPDTIERDPASGTKVAFAALLGNDLDPDSDLILFLGISTTSANGGTLLTNENWVYYTPPPEYTNVDAFTYTIGDALGAIANGLVTINTRADTNPSPNLTITNLGNGLFHIRGDGIPGREYHMEFSDELNYSTWQPLRPAQADEFGQFVIIDFAGTAQRFYRTVWP